MSPSSDARDPIEILAEEFMERQRRGERPTIAEYCARRPDLADQIRDLLSALAMSEDFEGEALAQPPVPPGDRPVRAGTPRQLGDYQILREVDRGGMGVVYEAVQQSLGRHVALKVMPWQTVGSATQVERFQLEARAAARLHHSNIVPVFGVGESDGLHYYAMQFIQGQGLDLVIKELRNLRRLDPRRPAGAPAEPIRAPRGAQPPPGAEASTAAAGGRPMLELAHSLAQRLITGGSTIPTIPHSLSDDPSAVGRTLAHGPEEPHHQPAPDADATIDQPSGVQRPPDRAPRTSRWRSPPSSTSTHSELIGGGQLHYFRGVARIGLQVAEALAYAHGQGILHRDVKPSNLLVDARGAVWVTDFGLAKAEGSDGPTQTGDIIGTLRYMAPERFEGWSDRRSDVYGLGATLYELITLRPLFDDSNRARLIERVIHEEPTPPRKLDPHIPRDLETIVIKALAKEPAARYQDAEKLADDLRRFLDDRPISARRVTSSERVVRWARRNPWLAGFAAAFLVAITGGLIGVTGQWQRAEREKDRANALRSRAEADRTDAVDARKLAEGRRIEAERQKADAIAQRALADANFARARAAVDEYFTKVSENQLLTVPGMQVLRGDLLRSALSFYEDFIRTRGDDPSLRKALAAVHLKAASIHEELGEHAKADDDYRAALRLSNAVLNAAPQDVEARESLADACLALGKRRAAEVSDFKTMSRYLLSKAVATREALVRADPRNDELKGRLAAAYLARGIADIDNRRVREALGWFLKAREITSQLVQHVPADAETQHQLAQILGSIADALCQLNRHQDETVVRPLAIEHARRAHENAPNILKYGYNHAQLCMRDAGNLASQNRWRDSHRAAVAGIEMLLDLNRRNPDAPGPASLLENATRQAIIHARAREAGWPRSERQRAFDELRALIGRYPRERPTQLVALATALLMLSTESALFDLGPDPDQARRDRADALDAFRRAVAAGYDDVPHARGLANYPDVRGDSAWSAAADQVRRNAAAARALARGEGAGGSNTAEGPATNATPESSDPGRLARELAASEQAIGTIQLALGDHEDARRTLRQALDLRAAEASGADRAVLLLSLDLASWKALRWGEAVRSWPEVRAAVIDALDTASHDQNLRQRVSHLLHEMVEEAARGWAWDAGRDVANLIADRGELRVPSSNSQLHRLASYFHAVGDGNRYRIVCAELYSRLARSEVNSEVESLAHVLTLGPDSGLDAAKVLEIAQRAHDMHPIDTWPKYARAFGLYRAGRYVAARVELRATMNTDPPFADREGVAYPLQAMIQYRLGNQAEADAALRRADHFLETTARLLLERPPGAPNPRTRWWILGDFLGMDREARNLIRGDQPGVEPWTALLAYRAARLMDEPERTDARIASVLETAANPAEILALKSRIDAQTEDTARARTRGSTRDAHSATAWLERAAVLAELHETDKAHDAYERALAARPTELDDVRLLQAYLLREGRTQEARALTASLLDAVRREWRQPLLTPVTSELDGKLYPGMGRPASIVILNLRQGPVIVHYHDTRSERASYPPLRPGSSINVVNDTHDLHPWLITEPSGKPLALFFGTPEGGVAAVHEFVAEEASDAPPSDPRLLPAWANVAAQRGQYERLIETLDGAIADRPRDGLLRMKRAQALDALGRTDDARTDFTRAVDLAVEDSEQLRPMGQETGGRGDWARAAALYDRALERDPANHWNWYVRGPIYLLMGDRAGYRRHCAAMIERFRDSEDPGIQERTAKICALDADPATDLDVLVRLADRAIRGAGDSPYQPYFIATRAVVELRRPHRSPDEARRAVEGLLGKYETSR
jgi:tetratricopeptide (TPR) repeat protein